MNRLASLGQELEAYANATDNSLEEVLEERLVNLRQAAEIHRNVRKMAMERIKPGMSMTEIAEIIENGTRSHFTEEELTTSNPKYDASGSQGGPLGGIAFPTGLSLNHCAAHWTPNGLDNTILKEKDICKIDFGVHINGCIIDSAFTYAANPKFDGLKSVVQEATEAGIKASGIDVRMCDIGAAIQEVMEAGEVAIDNEKLIPVKCIRNLNGHSIEPYRIHAGNSVPIVRNGDGTRMKAGEQYAIETFGSTGKGLVYGDTEVSHYMWNPESHSSTTHHKVRYPGARKLGDLIRKNFGSLAFCKRYIDRLGEKKYQLALKALVEENVIDPYPPLCDVKGSYTAQYEHTIFIKPNCTEVLSRGDDY